MCIAYRLTISIYTRFDNYYTSFFFGASCCPIPQYLKRSTKSTNQKLSRMPYSYQRKQDHDPQMIPFNVCVFFSSSPLLHYEIPTERLTNELQMSIAKRKWKLVLLHKLHSSYTLKVGIHYSPFFFEFPTFIS